MITKYLYLGDKQAMADNVSQYQGLVGSGKDGGNPTFYPHRAVGPAHLKGVEVPNKPGLGSHQYNATQIRRTHKT